VPSLGEQIHSYAVAGVPKIEIAHRLGIAQSTVHYHLRKLTGPEASGPMARRPGRRANSGVPTRQLVADLLKKGLTRAEIGRRLDLAKSTVSYHARELGLPVDDRARRRYDWDLVQRYYDLGHSVRECARVFGFSTWSWHEATKRGAIRARPVFMPLNEVLAPNTRRGRGHLKLRLLRAGLKENRCEVCGLSEWLGQSIGISLHHINGDRHDNRLENLQFLCPNCHSQTDTWGGRNNARPAA
jgi:DNA-binding CsgD family transcriptional regulator